MADTDFTVGLSRYTAHSISYSDASSTVNLEITNGNVKPVISTILNALGAADDLYGNLTITYSLEDDRVGTASIKPMYSITGYSGTYLEMTEYTGGSSDGKNNLTTSAAGVTHTFDWDTTTDLGLDYQGTVFIKIRAYDRINLIGDYIDATSIPLKIENQPEAPTITSPTTGWFDKNTTPQIVGTIPNPKAGYSNLHIKVEIATDSTFSTIELTLESAVDQLGWEYDSDGAGAWLDIPVTGIPVSSDNSLVGNSWMVTLQTENELTQGQKYIRAYAGGILV